MALMLALIVTFPADSLTARLRPVVELVRRADSTLAAGATGTASVLTDSAGRLWAAASAGLTSDSAGSPEGWRDGSVLVSSRIAETESLLAVGRVDDAARFIRSLDELLYWLPRPKPTLLRFLGYRCESCLAMDKVLARVAARYLGRALLRTVDINVDEATARRYRVTGVPTLVFLDPDGRESSRAAREMSEGEIGVRLDALLERD